MINLAEPLRFARPKELYRDLYTSQVADQTCPLQTEAEQQPTETYEIEQWLIDFANLFRDALGVEPDKHLDLTNFGWEKLQGALDTAVLSDEAPALFDKAADKFQEVTAHGELSVCCLHQSHQKTMFEQTQM